MRKTEHEPCSTHPLENEALARLYPEYVDVWAELHPDLRGLTFDTGVNRMISGNEQMRYSISRSPSAVSPSLT